MKVLERNFVRRYRAGYEIWDVKSVMGPMTVEVIDDPDGNATELAAEMDAMLPKVPEAITVRSAFTPEGDYIGTPLWAYRLCKTRGVKPEKMKPDNNVCAIGFCEREQKWYGWSHRAIYGFGIGDIVKEGDCTATSGWTDEYLAEHPEDDLRLPIGFTAKSLDDAKRMAVAFAESVG